MKKLLLVLFHFIAVFLSAQTDDGSQKYTDSLVHAAQAEVEEAKGEHISSFHSDITVLKDASLQVVETITVHVTGDNIKHGIFRRLPLNRNLNGKSQKVKYTKISVTKNGASENFAEEYSDGDLKIYIGDKDIVLSPGDYTYVISYSTKNQIGFFPKYDELYWNVNGTQWDFLVAKISATVHLPQGAKIIQNSCYTGEVNSRNTNCTSQIISNTEIAWSAEYLRPAENLTIAVGFDKGIVLPPPPPTFLQKYGVALFLALAFLGLLVGSYLSWKKYGVDPPKPVVYPQFNVPEGFSPASLGYLKNEKYKENYISAALVNLAVKGFIQIKENEKSKILGFSTSNGFKIIKLKPADQSLAPEEIGLMNNLFKGKESININGSYSSKVRTALTNFQASLSFQHDKLLNEGGNTKHLLYPSLFVAVCYIIGLRISNFLDDGDGLEMFGGGFLLVILAIAYAVIVYGLKKIKLIGCAIPFVMYFVVICCVMIFANGLSLSLNYKACFAFLLFSFGILLLLKYLIKRPSEEKLRQQSLIDGFKMYMNAAENEQLKFHNPPKMTPEVFETLLPYAMVLGVDAIWGQKFAHAMQSAATEYQQGWYVGGSAMDFSRMASSLNSSLTQSVSSSATKPSSSSSSSGWSSSSSSGSSGGGFSGGGGGGGGGGGW